MSEDNNKYANKIIVALGTCIALMCFLYNKLNISSTFLTGVTLSGTCFAIIDFFQYIRTSQYEIEKIKEIKARDEKLKVKIKEMLGQDDNEEEENQLDLKNRWFPPRLGNITIAVLVKLASDDVVEFSMIFIAMACIFMFPYYTFETSVDVLNNRATLLGFGTVIIVIGLRQLLTDALDLKKLKIEQLDQIEEYIKLKEQYDKLQKEYDEIKNKLDHK